MDIVTYALAKKLVNGVQSGLANATVDNANCSITFNWTNGTSSTLTFPKPADGVKGDKGDTGVSVQNVEIREISGVRHLIVTLDDSTEIDVGILPNEQYDDTQVKADIAKLKSDKQDKTDNGLDTTDKTVIGAINEVNGNQLDTVGFSADYKNIILNRKNGLNPYIIPIASIIHNAKLVELGDVDSTDIGNGKTLVYDGTTKKHKYADSTGTDELVKMEASTDAHYLSDLIDKSTIVNDNGTLKVKKLDGQNVSITEINYLKGLTMNVMDLVNMFSNGGVKIINTPVATYADLLTYDKKDLIDGISYLIYVLADETHDGSKTTYLIDTTSTTPTYFGNADNQRNFTTNPIDLASEVTGKLGTSNIDVDALWNLLTINDTYKTLTTKDEVFGTHGAKALYDELVTAIGGKANSNDLTTHTGDTDIHITTAERTKWNEVDNKVNKTDIVDNLTSTNTDKPLSANQGKVLKGEVDKKANDNEVIKKTDLTTTIDYSSTDAQVPSAKSIYYNCIEGIEINQTTIDTYGTEILKYPLGIWRIRMNAIASKFTDLPIKFGGRIEITSIDANANINPWNTPYCYRVYNFETYNGGNYIRKIENRDIIGVITGDTGWQRLCTTSVADVPFTDITSKLKNCSARIIGYSVKNGICRVKINGLKPNTQSVEILATGILPTPDPIHNGHFNVMYTTGNMALFMIYNSSTDGVRLNSCNSTISGDIYCTLEYPVKQS